jgi:hypothetical protein
MIENGKEEQVNVAVIQDIIIPDADGHWLCNYFRGFSQLLQTTIRMVSTSNLFHLPSIFGTV